MMETALGILGWSPSEFWKANVTEYTLAVRGYCRKNGIEIKESDVNRSWLADLKERVERGKAG